VPAPREFALDGLAAIVTGGSRSIGRAVAKVFAEAGADVTVGARTTEDLQDVVSEIEALGRQGLAVTCDVDDPDDVERLVSSTVDAFGRLDVLVANAGRFQVKPSEEVTAADFDSLLTTNLRGVALSCLAAGRRMIELGNGGSIVTIASIQGAIALPRTMSYVTSKHGVIGLTKALALDWAHYGIRVNAIAPGFIARDVEPLQDDPAFVEFVTSRTPLRRWGAGREVGLAAAFLASRASSYVTGATLAVDGGWLAD
jgi:NAD(P)-dependent dehydrogenase (short-subunit alcohol dehydrogenase family)